MRAADLTPQELDRALARWKAGEEWDAIGPSFGKSGNAIRKCVRRGQMAGVIEAQGERKAAAPAAEPPKGVAWTQTQEGATIESGKSATIRTLDDLLAVCDVDLSRWTVDRFVVNKWDSVMRGPDDEPATTELFQVKAWLSPIKGADAAAELVAGLIADMEAHAPRYVPVAHPAVDPRERHLLVASMADHHIGMLAWGEETGQGDYDSAIAERLASDAMGSLLQKASAYPCERILVLIGGDWYHTDRTIEGKGGTTTAGTPQDVDTRSQKMWRTGIRAAVAIIDSARALAPVTVQLTVGNHDTDRLMALGDVLDAWYRNDDQVEIRNAPTPRHYFQYGATLLGFCHGHQAKGSDLPLLMASEAPTEWATTEFREWLTGHFHAKRVVSDDKAGVQVHVTPSLCPPDGWHAGRGLLHRRSCEARIYHITDGPIATLTFNAKRVRP